MIKRYGMKREMVYHALFDYAMKLGAILETNETQVKDHNTPAPDCKNMLIAIATVYGVEPQAMQRPEVWIEIDRVCIAHNFKPIPAKVEYRKPLSTIILN